MAKKKEAQEAAGKKQAVRRKKQADIEIVKEDIAEEFIKDVNAVKEFIKDVKPFELCIVFAQGDNIDMIAKQLTGKSYMAFKVCEYSGVRYQDVRPGTILKWPMR